MDVVLGQYLLQTTLRQHLVVHMSAIGRIVAEALVPVLPDAVRRQSVQDRLLVPSTAVDPPSDLVEHLLLDLR
jgi:hypothetical protein